MAVFKRLRLSDIDTTGRVLPVDEDLALAIAASMAEIGLICPITVRHTPAAKTAPYKLVVGGHRHRGAELNQWQEIDCLVVEANSLEARLMELSENIYRNELSKLDRAIFVLTYREAWEEKHGQIDPKGGRPKKQGNDYPVIFTSGRELSRQVCNRLGFGPETYKIVNRIGQNLRPELRTALRATPYADDQSTLLKLAKRPPEEQVKVAAALEHEPDLKKVLAFGKPPKPVVSRHEAAIARLRTAWHSADAEARTAFLAEIGLDPRDYPEALEAAE